VQDRDDPFISRVEGDLDNVIGLPLKAVRRLLRKAALR
jgi:predicted house-cleaning NTP pyrophosphatase (Maf/HAM1 superfamily)